MVAAAPDDTESFAYGVVVARVTDWFVSDDVHPPAVVTPAVDMVPQDMSPDPLVCNAWPPTQVAVPVRVRVDEMRVVPVTSRVFPGFVVPMPTLPLFNMVTFVVVA